MSVPKKPRLLQQALGEAGLGEREAVALYVAAIREVFEEAGVLFAQLPDAARLRDLLEMRAARADFAQVIDAAGAPLDSASLAPWWRWVTPRRSMLARKHFDARFSWRPCPPAKSRGTTSTRPPAACGLRRGRPCATTGRAG